MRVVLINDSRRRPATVALRAPGAAASATGVRLRAPRVAAKAGVTLGGQSFGAATTTGRLGGPQRQFTLARVQGRFVVRLPPASATLLAPRSR